MAEKTKQGVKIKDLQIKKTEETIQGLDSKIKDRDIKTKNLLDKVKELEAQLLIERKLARQNVDSKITEQHQLKKHQEDQINSAQTLTEDNGCKPSLPFPTIDSSIRYIDLNEKENNAETAEELLIPPKGTRRATICPITLHNPTSIASRRNSMIPLPSTPCFTQLMSPLVKVPTNLADQKEGNDESETNC